MYLHYAAFSYLNPTNETDVTRPEYPTGMPPEQTMCLQVTAVARNVTVNTCCSLFLFFFFLAA